MNNFRSRALLSRGSNSSAITNQSFRSRERATNDNFGRGPYSTFSQCTPCETAHRLDVGRSPIPRTHDDFAMKLTIEVFSDVICPWCYIGKRRLEKALELLGGSHDVQVLWRPFQLNPGMPPGGIDRRAYRTAKFGSWERSLELEARVAAVGAEGGIPFAFDRIARTPNTFDAHRLIWYAQQQGRHDVMVEALFQAYFMEGRDIGDRRVLADIAAKAGLDQAEGFLASDHGADDVRHEEDRGHRLGIDGVPHFLFNGRVTLSGAQEPETILAAIEKAVRKQAT
jgi:predicted DsbA family dithiol-disulfide isomerase